MFKTNGTTGLIKNITNEETCHCGNPIHFYAELDNFTRGLCLDCSTVRCDIDPTACK